MIRGLNKPLRTENTRYGGLSEEGELVRECSVLPLANIGNDSRTTLKMGKMLMRAVFDLEARRKPQAFAADA